MDVNLGNERIGETRKNLWGSTMVIENYIHSRDMWVRFIETGNLTHTSWYHFVRGNVKNVYDKSIFGVGYIGEGTYKTRVNGVTTPKYRTWHDMLKRCYDTRFHEKQPTYKNCYVAEVWHNFQNFAKWYDENYYIIEDEIMCLDKDIIKKGNKVYSPETCIYAPKSINSFFMSRRKGKYPYGVSRSGKKYVAKGRNREGKTIVLGYFEKVEEAFKAYKIFKESIIKQLAEEYKDKVPNNLYNALLNYKIEINDQ